MTHAPSNEHEHALAVLKDYVELGSDRPAALRALKVLEHRASRVKGAELEMTAALGYVDSVCTSKESEVTYGTLQRSGFKRKEGWRRRYTLSDARSDARCAAIRLRNAWNLLDPIGPKRPEMEALMNNAGESYFDEHVEIRDCGNCRKVFDAGFEQGWGAALTS